MAHHWNKVSLIKISLNWTTSAFLIAHFVSEKMCKDISLSHFTPFREIIPWGRTVMSHHKRGYFLDESRIVNIDNPINHSCWHIPPISIPQIRVFLAIPKHLLYLLCSQRITAHPFPFWKRLYICKQVTPFQCSLIKMTNKRYHSDYESSAKALPLLPSQSHLWEWVKNQRTVVTHRRQGIYLRYVTCPVEFIIRDT